MNEREDSGDIANRDEAPEEGDARGIADGPLEYPALGPNAEVVHDDESQARHSEDTDPSEEELDGDHVDGNSERGGTPPGTDTHGA